MGYAEGNTQGFTREDMAMESINCSTCPYFYECDNVDGYTTCKYERRPD